MSITTLDYGIRRARKAYRCQMCGAGIGPRDHYAYQSNVYDDRAYTWRECLACKRDSICVYVVAYCDPDTGADYECAYEWATEAMFWPMVGWRTRRPMSATEHAAARNWLARAALDGDR